MTTVALTGIISAAPMPWTTRAAMIHSCPSEPAGARPHIEDARKKITTPIRNAVTGPILAPSLPPSATIAAMART